MRYLWCSPLVNFMNTPKIEINYSLEGTDIEYEVDKDGYLIVSSLGMTIKSADKVAEGTNLNALALAMRDAGIKTLRKNGNTIFICVYKDTITSHNDAENLSEIEVTDEFVKQYYEECIKTSECEFRNSYDEFISNYTADDTEDFYEYAKKHNAIIQIHHW